MCKIVAAATNKDIYNHINILFKAASSNPDRDAAGFFAWSPEGCITDKRGLDSKDFVAISELWKSMKENPHNLIICHARGATGGATPTLARNNHPFVGKNIALAHEGWIPNHRELAELYEVKLETDTDSELFLRILDDRFSEKALSNALVMAEYNPCSLAVIDFSAETPALWFAQNDIAEHSFYAIHFAQSTILVSGEELKNLATTFIMKCEIEELTRNKVHKFTWSS